MTLLPDLGLHLIRLGHTSDSKHHFSDFPLFTLTVLGRGQYSTVVNSPWGGELYAMSLDFNQEHLDAILSKAPPHINSIIRSELTRDPSSPRSIDFEGKVMLQVTARLGEIQKGPYETFVPFIAEEIK